MKFSTRLFILIVIILHIEHVAADSDDPWDWNPGPGGPNRGASNSICGIKYSLDFTIEVGQPGEHTDDVSEMFPSKVLCLLIEILDPAFYSQISFGFWFRRNTTSSSPREVIVRMKNSYS